MLHQFNKYRKILVWCVKWPLNRSWKMHVHIIMRLIKWLALINWLVSQEFPRSCCWIHIYPCPGCDFVPPGGISNYSLTIDSNVSESQLLTGASRAASVIPGQARRHSFQGMLEYVIVFVVESIYTMSEAPAKALVIHRVTKIKRSLLLWNLQLSVRCRNLSHNATNKCDNGMK